MDRRDFLKRSIAAATAIALVIDKHDVFLQAICQTGTAGNIPRDKTSGFATNRLIYGGNLFNGYGRGRESVDVSEPRVQKTRLSQTGFLAGWATNKEPGTHQFC